jgi:hypothetical protein
MTAQSTATQKALASVPASLASVPASSEKTVLQEPGIGQSKRRPIWAMSVTERRARWLRLKHPKMDAETRQRWAENAQLKTAPSCSR